MAGKPVRKEELARLLQASILEIEDAIASLTEKYRGPIILRETDDTAFMTVEDRFLESLWFLGKGELSKSELKTLAMIAYYAPVLQSDIVHSRGNRAYEHIRRLEELGLISTAPAGNTRLLKLSRRFFEYFGDRIVERIRASQAFKKHEAGREEDREGVEER